MQKAKGSKLTTVKTLTELKQKDIAKYVAYLTKQVILEIYDKMTECKKNGTQYQTRLDPPPADPRLAHGYKEEGEFETPNIDFIGPAAPLGSFLSA